MSDYVETIYVPPLREHPLEKRSSPSRADEDIDPDLARNTMPADMKIIDEPEILEVPEINATPPNT